MISANRVMKKQLRNNKYSHNKTKEVPANATDQLISVEEMTKSQ
jgi:hypothetical protein